MPQYDKQPNENDIPLEEEPWHSRNRMEIQRAYAGAVVLATVLSVYVGYSVQSRNEKPDSHQLANSTVSATQNSPAPSPLAPMIEQPLTRLTAIIETHDAPPLIGYPENAQKSHLAKHDKSHSHHKSVTAVTKTPNQQPSTSSSTLAESTVTPSHKNSENTESSGQSQEPMPSKPTKNQQPAKSKPNVVVKHHKVPSHKTKPSPPSSVSPSPKPNPNPTPPPTPKPGSNPPAPAPKPTS